MKSPTADRDEIARALAVLYEPGDVVELRAPDSGKFRTQSGYFDDLDRLADAAYHLGGSPPATYVSLNPVTPALLARAHNRVQPYAKVTTGNDDIVKRRWLPLDFDAVRPAGISSTDAEHEAALEAARAGQVWLRDNLSFSPHSLLLADSGNGAHLVGRIDLPNTPEATVRVQRCIEAVALYCNTPAVQLDLTVANAARIWKAYGTVARKGDDLPERPHRLARLLEVPDTIVPISAAQLAALATLCPAAPRAPRGRRGDHNLDPRTWLPAHGVTIKREKLWRDRAIVYELVACVFNPEHNRGEACVIQFPNGAVCYRCFHQSCTGKTWADLRTLVDPGGRRQIPAGPRHSAPPLLPPAEGDDPIHLTDVGNARRLVAAHGADLRYCKAWKTWLVWDGCRWVRDQRDQVIEYAKAITAEFFREAAAAHDPDTQRRLAKHALGSQRAERVRAMVLLAQSEPGIALLPADLDTDPYLLNVLNGTIDLRTGALREHQRTDLITRLAPVEYSPDVQLELWDRFLREATAGCDPPEGPKAADAAQNAAALRVFLQRAAGYSLTGDTGEEVLFLVHGPEAAGKSTFVEALKATLGDYARTADFETFLFLVHGPEAAGKSTFVEALKATLGDYARTADFETFLAKKGDGGIRNDVARLVGARFVASIEVEEGKKLAEGLVKQLTGGDTVTARFLYAESFQFAPAFKLWLAVNQAPRVTDQDGGIWRRILRVPFEHTVPKEKRDRTIKATLKNPAVCGPAILAWAVAGCLAWQRDGLGIPPIIEEATAQYRADQDPLRDFYAQRCVFEAQAWVASAALYVTYQTWARENGVRQSQVLSNTAVGRRLRARGCLQRTGEVVDKTDKRKKARGWTGVRLHTEADAEADDFTTENNSMGDDFTKANSSTTNATNDSTTHEANEPEPAGDMCTVDGPPAPDARSEQEHVGTRTSGSYPPTRARGDNKCEERVSTCSDPSADGPVARCPNCSGKDWTPPLDGGPGHCGRCRPVTCLEREPGSDDSEDGVETFE